MHAGEAAPKRKTRKERVALKKAQKRAAKARADSDEEDGPGGDFAVDLSDPRFEVRLHFSHSTVQHSLWNGLDRTSTDSWPCGSYERCPLRHG